MLLEKGAHQDGIGRIAAFILIKKISGCLDQSKKRGDGCGMEGRDEHGA